MKQFLKEEVAPRQMRLVESSQDSSNSHCLGTMYGPCADFNNPTRNGNFYSKKLWENVFKDDIVKESLQDRILIGELDHPETRLETKATNACIVMTDYEFHDNEGLLYGKFDILPTPNGRILKSLIDCGCKIGVSSRGEGDVTVETTEDFSSEVNKVDENNYEFVAFDAVVLPAVKAAKPSLQESLNHTSLKESLQKEVDSATTVSELEVIKDVVEATNLPDADSLLESVKNKSQELSNGTTSSSELIEDLEKSNDIIQKLKEEIEQLKMDITTSKSKYKKQLQSRQKLVRESREVEKDFALLQEKYNSLAFKSASKLKKVESSLSDTKKVIVSLKEKCSQHRDEVSQYKEEISQYKRDISSLEESLSKSQEFSKNKLQEIKVLQKELESLKESSSKRITESTTYRNKVQKNYEKSQKQVSDLKSTIIKMKEAYITERCKRYGVSYKEVIDQAKSAKTLKEVDKLISSQIDRKSRHESLSFTDDHLIDILQESTIRFSDGQIEADKELDQTIKFMDEANKLF